VEEVRKAVVIDSNQVDTFQVYVGDTFGEDQRLDCKKVATHGDNHEE